MRPRKEQPPIKLILNILENLGQASVHDLALVLSIDKRNVRQYLKILKADKKIYISGYSKEKRGPALPLYSKGNRKDKEYPPPLPAYTKKLRYLERKEKKCLSILWWI